MNQLIAFLEQVRSSSSLSKLEALRSAVDADDFFSIAFFKDEQTLRKRSHFFGKKFEKVIVVTNPTNYGNVSSEFEGYTLTTIEDTKLASADFSLNQVRTLLDHSLVIMTNNNVATLGLRRFASIYESCPNTVFATHDFDNHHWFELSLQIGTISDVYIPAHLDDYALIGRINSNILHGIPCGSIQWSRAFLSQASQTLFTTARIMGPLGVHTFYDKFHYRNRVIKTVNRTCPDVRLLYGDFHSRGASDRWNEWCTYRLHWIAPVFNDLPIRFFDALLTGGTPLVPASLRPFLTVLDIPKEYYTCYTPKDLIDVSSFLDEVSSMGSTYSNNLAVEKHEFALNNYHVDATIAKIIDNCESIFCTNL
jgi:hypothetical protein